MKRLLFVINNLEIGGVQSSLINLLNEISGMYDITLLTFFYRDSYRELIPSSVKLLTTSEPFSYLGMSQNDAKSSFFTYLSRAFYVILSKLIGRSNVFKLMSIGFEKIKGYDCAISFLHEGNPKMLYGGCNDFVISNIQADKKITWVHCDISLSGGNSDASRKIYEQFDKIIACSEGTASTFIKCMPEFSEKTYSIRNCNNYDDIAKNAENPLSYNSEFINVITVARVAEEKGIERGIKAIKFCVDNGINVLYHIVGDGSQLENMKKLAADLGIERNVVFYGNQRNPYKYMVNADLFLLPSYHEAAPIVFDEAAYLGVPVLTTNTLSVNEMIIETKSGFVCDNSQESITDNLFYLLKNIDVVHEIKRNLKKRVFDNKHIVTVFNELI